MLYPGYGAEGGNQVIITQCPEEISYAFPVVGIAGGKLGSADGVQHDIHRTYITEVPFGYTQGISVIGIIGRIQVRIGWRCRSGDYLGPVDVGGLIARQGLRHII
jgi:hypothetical protein